MAGTPERPLDDAASSEAPDRVRVRMVIAYDGTGYQGWQWQRIGLGVQQVVEEALARLFPSAPRVHGSSRTDTGVHALGMVAHFDVPRGEWRFSGTKLRLAVNAWLPEDVRVLTAARCAPEFHARFDALGKEYRYLIWNAPASNPLLRARAWHVPRKLDLAAMRAAAARLVGTHDFRAFSTNPGYERASTRRTLTRVVVQRRGPLLTGIIDGDGFLYRMCRGIAGTLVQVGLRRFDPEQMLEILTRRDRRLAGMTAPPHGLVLWKVRYAPSARTRRTGA